MWFRAEAREALSALEEAARDRRQSVRQAARIALARIREAVEGLRP